jgi:hypothetical protein
MNDLEKDHDNEQNKNVASRGPLIFTIPGSRFLVALNLDWLDVTERTAEVKRRAYNVTPATQHLDSATSKVQHSRFG